MFGHLFLRAALGLVFAALALVSDARPPAMPCGACRQVLREFAPDLPILAASTGGDRRLTSLDDVALGRGLQWAVTVPWVDEPLKSVLREAAG